MSNWSDSKLTKRLGISYPIIQGPFGRGGSSALLAATVSNAGGLGSFGANDQSPADIIRIAAEIRKLSDKPFGMNLWVSTSDPGGESLTPESYEKITKLLEPYYQELKIEIPPIPDLKPQNFNDQVAALIETRPAVFSFVFGIPSSEILRSCREKGILTVGAATTVDEAIACEQAGVDCVVASGFEAGGHRPSFLKAAEQSLLGTFVLVPQIAASVKIPVIAAGGIADGRGIVAAVTLGAQAVQIGTAFLACEESGASNLHRKMLFREESKYTALSRAFTGRLARVLDNRFAFEMQQHEQLFAKYPAHSWITAPLRAAALAQGRHDLAFLAAGQAAPLCRHHKASELFNSLVKEVDRPFEAGLSRQKTTISN
jgi:nitronate monooxygenase